MNKEEIIKYIEDEIEVDTDTFHWFDNIPNNTTRKDIEKSIQAHQGLLDLYNKAQERINYLEDGLEEGKQIIGELRRLLDKEKEKK